MAIKLRASILIVLVEMTEEEAKEQQHFLDEILLNLFKQRMLIIHYSLATIGQFRVKLSN